jgi:glycosyltransferase involved in cell wall biosynthesis
MKVLAIVPYQTDFCAGQRFRIEMWAKELGRRGIDIEFLSFTDKNLTDVLYQPGQYAKKASMMLGAFARQLTNALRAKKPDVVFIYREAALAGPAIIEKIVRRWRIPIIYDIDEPLFLPYVSPSNGRLNKLKFFSKVDELFKLSDCVFAANKALADYAAKFNDDVNIVPLTVDVERYKPDEARRAAAGDGKLKIAWVGTRTNQPNIEAAVPALRRLAKENEFTFRIIADDPMNFDGLDVDFVPWAYDVEVPKLQEAHIGIVPVKETPWNPWKFFFKTVQFMSLGMPIVGAATGSNLEIIEDGVNGFLAGNENDWHDKLKLLIENPDLRKELGANARKTVLERFDIEKQFDFLEDKFKKLKVKAQDKNRF